MDIEQVERVTELIYQSATEEGGWQHVTDTLSNLFGDAAIVIDHHATSGGDCPLTISTLFEHSLRDLHFEEYRSPLDNPAVAALMQAKVGTPFTVASFLDARTFESDPAVRAILHPQRIDKGMLVALERSERALSYMNVLRRSHQPDLEQEEQKLVSFLAKQIARALQFGSAIERARRRRFVARHRIREGWTMDGLLLIDGRCRVIDADEGALAILERPAGVSLRNGTLVASAPQGGPEDVARFIASKEARECAFVIVGAEGSITVLSVLSAQDSLRSGLPLNYRYVMLRHVMRDAPCRVEAVGQAYGLTKAEQRALAALCAVPTATAAAALIGISRETIKTHLSQIYAKTQCRSLAELMRLVGRFQ